MVQSGLKYQSTWAHQGTCLVPAGGQERVARAGVGPWGKQGASPPPSSSQCPNHLLWGMVVLVMEGTEYGKGNLSSLAKWVPRSSPSSQTLLSCGHQVIIWGFHSW